MSFTQNKVKVNYKIIKAAGLLPTESKSDHDRIGFELSVHGIITSCHTIILLVFICEHSMYTKLGFNSIVIRIRFRREQASCSEIDLICIAYFVKK